MPPSSRPTASSSSLMQLLKLKKQLMRRAIRIAKMLIRLKSRPPKLPSPKQRSTKRNKLLKTRLKRAIRRRQRRSRRLKLMPKRSRTRVERKRQ